MTDNEIIKALRKHSTDLCSKCKIQKTTLCNDCISEIERCALDLINRQQAKIEAFQMDNAQLESDVINAHMNYEHTQAEIERLQNTIIALSDYLDRLGIDKTDTSIVRIATELNAQIRANVKSETIEEFAERLKEKADVLLVGKSGNHYSVSDKDIDNIVKEMEGEK